MKFKLKFTMAMIVVFCSLVFIFAKIQTIFMQARMSYEKTQTLDRVQDFLLQASSTNQIIKEAIADSLAQIPHAARIRITMIHIRSSGTIMMDNPYGGSNPGNVYPEYAAERPLSDAFNFLSQLLAGQCAYVNVKDISKEIQSRYAASTVVAFMQCPITDEGRMVGMVGIGWDNNVPELADLPNIEQIMRTLVVKFAKAMNFT